MARPRELFNTPAPQAMSMMGQGIADAYARAGEIEGKGMLAMGQGIAQGLTSAASSIAGAYGDYKKMQSQIKTSEGFYNTMKEGGYLPPEMTAGIDNTVNSDVYKNMGTREKAQFWGDVKGYTGSALGQYYKMQQIEAEQKGLFNRTIAGRKPVPNMVDVASGLDAAVSDQSSAGTAPKAPAPMPGSEFNLQDAVGTLERRMIQKYGADYKARRISPTEQDMKEFGFR
jgi:hypothetical protein